jgi:two-component system CAI-1 autoinducer sensor kinase/phosphatase CqsS
MNHMIDLFLLSASAVNQQLAPTERVSMQDVVDAVIAALPLRRAVAARRLVSVWCAATSPSPAATSCRWSCCSTCCAMRSRRCTAPARAGPDRRRRRPQRPRLLFIDSGCGIAARQLPLIFERFYSYPPSSGSGIGLALCKDIVHAWQASIRCFSRELCYTDLRPRIPPACSRSPPASRTPPPRPEPP